MWELINLANHHPRVNILQPGPGVGGHCIAVDPWFIVAADPENARLIKTAREVNDAKPDHVVREILAPIADLASPVIATLGLAFKANIDDMRESPAVGIVRKLALSRPDAVIEVVEPHATVLPRDLRDLPNVSLNSKDDVLNTADVIALLVKHDKFGDIDQSTLTGKHVVDAGGFWPSL